MSNSCDPMDYIAHQVPLSMGFPRQEYWNEFPYPCPTYLPNPEIKLVSPAWQVNSLLLNHLEISHILYCYLLKLAFGITKFKLKFTWYIGIQKRVAILLRQHTIICYTIPVYKCLYSSFGEKIIILCISDRNMIINIPQECCFIQILTWSGSTFYISQMNTLSRLERITSYRFRKKIYHLSYPYSILAQ